MENEIIDLADGQKLQQLVEWRVSLNYCGITKEQAEKSIALLIDGMDKRPNDRWVLASVQMVTVNRDQYDVVLLRGDALNDGRRVVRVRVAYKIGEYLQTQKIRSKQNGRYYKAEFEGKKFYNRMYIEWPHLEINEEGDIVHISKAGKRHLKRIARED